MGKSDIKLEDSMVESPKDSQVFAPSDSPSMIDSQEAAEKWAKANGLDSIVITSDKTVFDFENIDHARNHAAYFKLQLFTIKF